MSDAAQALSDDDAPRAEVAARTALAARPSGEAAARADLALGLALRDARRPSEAAVALARALPRLADPALAAVARFERGQALLATGHAGAAGALFAELAARPDGVLARRARWREADALLAAGSPQLAVRAYQALLARDPSAPEALDARLSLAQGLRAAGQTDRAAATYRALWVEYPAEEAGAAAGRALRAWSAEGGPVPGATVEEHLARAARLLELALPREALTELDELHATPVPPEPAARALLLRALASLQLGRRADAETSARAIAANPAASDGARAGADLVRARVAAREGRVDEAAALYRSLALSRAEVPGLAPSAAHDLPEDAAFLAAWLYYDAGKFARASELLRAYARANPRSRRADDARWFEAWSLVRLGRRDDARRALARLERGRLAVPALYWQARLAATRDRERALYRRVLHEASSGSWYGLLAAGRLAAGGVPPPALAAAPSNSIADGPGAGPGGDALARAAELLGAGLRREAVAELRALASERHARGSAAALAQLAMAAGDAELPFRMARDHLGPTRRALRWLYPRAFPRLVPSAAHGAGADGDLYLAVMRRESAFRPEARSAAGAVGLVQLLPPTAERLAALHGVPAARVERLDAPEVSVPLGAAYLALLCDRFGDPVVALAAYNAGPVAAAAWARDRAGLPLDEWVEDVPFRETRRYVKNVTADWLVYRALWGNGVLALDGSRPVAAPREGVAF
jgi:soluble lytic murein transglycosylase